MIDATKANCIFQCFNTYLHDSGVDDLISVVSEPATMDDFILEELPPAKEKTFFEVMNNIYLVAGGGFFLLVAIGQCIYMRNKHKSSKVPPKSFVSSSSANNNTTSPETVGRRGNRAKNPLHSPRSPSSRSMSIQSPSTFNEIGMDLRSPPRSKRNNSNVGTSSEIGLEMQIQSQLKEEVESTIYTEPEIDYASTYQEPMLGYDSMQMTPFSSNDYGSFSGDPIDGSHSSQDVYLGSSPIRQISSSPKKKRGKRREL